LIVKEDPPEVVSPQIKKEEVEYKPKVWMDDEAIFPEYMEDESTLIFEAIEKETWGDLKVTFVEGFMVTNLDNRVEFASTQLKTKKKRLFRSSTFSRDTATRVDLKLDRENKILRIVSTEKPT
jgi:hypothetical protein